MVTTAPRAILSRPTLAAIAEVASRADLSACLKAICAEVGASSYLLFGLSRDRGAGQTRVIASNWIYDTVHALGIDGLAELASSPCCFGLGETPRPVELATGGGPASCLRLLSDHGHRDLYCLALRSGARRCHVLVSSTGSGTIDGAGIATAHLAFSYLVSRLPDSLYGETAAGPLSERERECLFWVSEGKTTEEVSLILGVTSNTVNSYIAHAIQKVGASNRAMAIANAIRAGAI